MVTNYIDSKSRYQMSMIYLLWSCLSLAFMLSSAVHAQLLLPMLTSTPLHLVMPELSLTAARQAQPNPSQGLQSTPALTASQPEQPLLKLSTLEWPPYTGASLPEQGETSRLLRKVFQSLGYQVQIQVMPWADAMAVVNQQKGFRGFFPEYPLSDARYVQSAAIGYSEIGLVEPVKSPLLLTSMLQLAAFKLGVVDGYLNMAELDVLIDAGTIQPIRHQSDRENILQVMAGKLDAAVIDKRVLYHLLKHDAELAPLAGQVQFSQSLIEHRSLHLVLPATPENKVLLNQFNQALLKLKTQFVGSQKK
jgi:polar amino acid transport system substrate-binding protein